MPLLCILLLCSSYQHIMLPLAAHHPTIIKLLFLFFNYIPMHLIGASISPKSQGLHKLIHDLLLTVSPPVVLHVIVVTVRTLQREIVVLILIYYHFGVYKLYSGVVTFEGRGIV